MKLTFLQNIRVLTLLMILAGVFLGMFATNLLARPSARHRTAQDAAIDAEVGYYQDTYKLNDVEADAVRQALRRHEMDRLALLRALQAKHQHDFDAVRERTKARIREVLQKRKRDP